MASDASTIQAMDARIGSAALIIVTRQNASYGHSIQFRFGDLTGYIGPGGDTYEMESIYSNTTVLFFLPYTFYAQLPAAKEGTCNLICTTYDKSGNQIGEPHECAFTVSTNANMCKPTITCTVEDSNEATIAVTGDANKLVRYHSDAFCTVDGQAKLGASITRRKINGVVNTGEYTVTGVESNSIVFSVTDSRGYETTETVELDMVDYVLLTNNPAGRRTDPVSGNAELTVKGNYFNNNFGAADNTLSVKYRVKEEGGEYGAYSDVEYTITGNSYAAAASLSGLDYRKTYIVEVVVSDALDAVTKEAKVRKGIPIFDFGENDVAFNVPVFFSSGIAGEESALVKRFSDGVWIGNDAPAEDSGAFVAKVGYSGMFINLEQKVTYIVQDDAMQNIYLGDAIAIFG